MRKTAIDLFCGGGGASIGLKSAGYDVIAAFDINQKPLDSHAKNFPNTRHFLGDVRVQSFSSYEGITHLHASPPCQAFSNITANSSKPRHESSRELWIEVARAIEECRPETVSIENVPQYTETVEFSQLLSSLHGLGYHTFATKLLASDYGVPQSRRRMFLLAIRTDTLGNYNISHTSTDLFAGRFFCTEFKEAPGPYPVDVLWDLIDEMEPYEVPNWKQKRLKKIGIDPQNCPVGLIRNGQAQLAGRRLFFGAREYCPTLTKNHWHHWDISTGEDYRQVGIRGLARLQGFPDWYRFPKGKFMSGHIIGNSVPPPLMESIMLQLTH